MAETTGIEWTEATWNPIVGCSIVSPGCTNCYAMKMADRLEAMAPQADGVGNPHLLHYHGTTTRGQFLSKPPVWTGKLALAPEQVLLAPLRRRKPTVYFVNSMGDLFHEGVPDAWIDRVFAVMALTPQHTYQVLTKRSARMLAYMTDPATMSRVAEQAARMAPIGRDISECGLIFAPGSPTGYQLDPWPLRNVWLGVSAEDQRRAAERIPDLLDTPAAIRFVSAEPLLGPIDFSRLMWPVHGWWRGPYRSYAEAKTAGAECGLKRQALVGAWCRFLDWIIVGGESGAGARPMEDAWAESIVEQCSASGTAVFVKQMGGPVKARMRPIPEHLMVRQFPEVRR